MDFDELIESAAADFRKDPRNKVFASQKLLIASVLEESGKSISPQELASIVRAYEEGSIDGEAEEIYDAAVYSCGVLARRRCQQIVLA